MRLSIDGLGSVADARSGEEWSGAVLACEAARRTTVLRRLGAAPGRTVAILHGNSPSFFADLFATWQAGACAVCLNPALTADEVRTLVAFTAPVAVLTDGRDDVPEDLGVPVAAVADDTAPDGGSDLGMPASGLDDDALILFTSGTTGEPKGVVHTFRSLLARVALNQQHIGADAMAQVLCTLPTHFGHGLIGNCLTPLLAGGRVVLAATAPLQVAGRLGGLVDEHGITFMSSVPSFWKLVLKLGAPPPGGGTLRRVHVGSAPLSAELWQRVIDWAGTRDVANLYGITETANWLAAASAAGADPTDGAIGRMWGGSAAVRADDGAVRRHGVGELLVQSPSLMRGYYKRPDLTAAVLRDGWFHTGDIARIDDDGTMHLIGRQKDEINRGGPKVHPADIDILMERHPAVREACAFAVPDEVAGETVGIAVDLADRAAADIDELRRWCAHRLVREKVPEHWFVVEQIPKTDRGKVSRAAVAAHCLHRDERRKA